MNSFTEGERNMKRNDHRRQKNYLSCYKMPCLQRYLKQHLWISLLFRTQWNLGNRRSKITLADLTMLGLLKEVSLVSQQSSADPLTRSLKSTIIFSQKPVKFRFVQIYVPITHIKYLYISENRDGDCISYLTHTCWVF